MPDALRLSACKRRLDFVGLIALSGKLHCPTPLNLVLFKQCAELMIG